MPSHPTGNRSQGVGNIPGSQKDNLKEDNKSVTGLPHQEDEEITDKESKPEDFKKFDVDKVEELDKLKSDDV